MVFYTYFLYLFYFIDKSEKDDEKAPFLQNIESINKSKPVEVAKDVTKVVVKALGSFKDDFVDELNQKSKAQKNGKIFTD